MNRVEFAAYQRKRRARLHAIGKCVQCQRSTDLYRCKRCRDLEKTAKVLREI
jgi:hypothetical protein